MKRRIISFILCLVMIAGLFPFSAFTLVHAATTSQTNIVARANYLYGLTWTCQQDVSGWRGNYTFTKGKTYRLPYGQPINTGEYIGHVVLVTGLTYSGSTLTKVEITEQTPPQLKRTTYTPEQLISKYSSAYTILRYNNYVPASPGGSGSGDSGSGDSGSSGGSGSSITTKYFPACASSYESIVSALNSIGVDSSKDYRTIIAQANGITGYSGTADQNNTLVSLLLEGKLIDPNPTANISLYKYLPACSSACDTITKGLDEIGVASTKTYRTTIAAINGFTDYTGTYEQNVTMLDMLKAGILRNPEYVGLSTSAVYYPACSSTCTSIAAGLSDICADNSPAKITEIAMENGMLTYSGSSDENTTLLNLLKSGKLINPDPSVALTRNKYYPACISTASSLIAGLKDVGVESSYNYRTEIAAANGILNYSDSSAQNTTMLNLLKNGRLVHARYPGFMDSGSVNNGNTGYDRGYQGGMEGTGWIAAHGLDISSWQGSSVDFSMIKNAGYDYVILRAGTTNGKDTLFESNYTKARAAGLDIGVYFYTYATTVAAAQTDANSFLSYISGKKFEYPVYMDYEDETQQALSSTLSQQICLAFMAKLKAAGYLTGMYTGRYFANKLPMSTICADYEVWIAQYPKTGDDCTNDWMINGYDYADDYGMYQYASKVYVNGTYGPYDGNVCYKEYPTIVKKYGFNGYASACNHSYQATVTAPTCTNAGYTTYVCAYCSNSYTGNPVAATGHSYLNGSCTACGTANLSSLTDFYLFGYINGSDYACESDADNLGEYKFENGKLVATFTQDSYIFLKTGDNANWYMTKTYVSTSSGVFYSTSTGAAEKMYIPGNM